MRVSETACGPTGTWGRAGIEAMSTRVTRIRSKTRASSRMMFIAMSLMECVDRDVGGVMDVIRVWSSAVGKSEGDESVENKGVENKGGGGTRSPGPQVIAHRPSHVRSSTIPFVLFYILHVRPLTS